MQLLGLERALQDDLAEMFGREARDARELELFLQAEGVADLDGPVVVQADDVPGEGFLHAGAVLGHEDCRVADLHVLADAVVADLHALFVLARTDAHEGDAVAVGLVHVRLDLEDHAREVLLKRRDLAGQCRTGTRAGGQLDEGAQHFLHAEVVDGAAKKTGVWVPAR